MKKIFLLLLVPFILGGCYDYNGLNDLAIISGIGIDYEEEEFKVTFEVISTKKEGDSSAPSSTYYVTSTGESIVYAFTSAANQMDKVPYFEHVEMVVFSKDVAENHLEECIDYLIRTERLRNEFYTVIAEDSAEELVTASSKDHPINSTYLVELLEFNSETFNSAYYSQFTKSVNSMLSDGEDAMMPVFKIKGEDTIELSGLGVFRDFQLVHIFDNDQPSIINLLHNFNVESVHFKRTCGENQNIVIAIYRSDVAIQPSENGILVSAVMSARISESTCDYDLKKADTYTELEKEFVKTIETKMDEVLRELQAVQSNALNIGRIYYNQYRIKDFYSWTNQNIEYDINLKINKKGLTFEVNK